MKCNDMQMLADEMMKIVRRYFTDYSVGRIEPYISASDYDIKRYTFGIANGYLNGRTKLTLKRDRYGFEDITTLKEFKQEMRKLLKANGYTKVAFNVRKEKCLDSWYNEYTQTCFNNVYFDA